MQLNNPHLARERFVETGGTGDPVPQGATMNKTTLIRRWRHSLAPLAALAVLMLLAIGLWWRGAGGGNSCGLIFRE